MAITPNTHDSKFWSTQLEGFKKLGSDPKYFAQNLDVYKFGKLDPDDPDEFADRVDGYGTVYSYDRDNKRWEKTGSVKKGSNGEWDLSTLTYYSNAVVNIANGYELDDDKPWEIS